MKLGKYRLPKPAILLFSALCALSADGLASAQSPAYPGDAPLSSIPETHDIREMLYDSFFAAPTYAAIAFASKIVTNSWGVFSTEVIVEESAYYLLLRPKKGKDWPRYGQGAWIIKRNRSDGSFVQAKVFLRSDPGTFIRLYPFGERSKMDVVAYGGVLNRGVILPVNFNTLITSRISEIVGWTEGVVEWNVFSPWPESTIRTRSLVEKVRGRISDLDYATDGAFDDDGTIVAISSGEPLSGPPGVNCSGFVKWLVDGICKPVTGRYFSVDEVKKKFADDRGSSFSDAFESSRDPFFGLDWTRSLSALAADSISPAKKHGIRDQDITYPPFAAYNPYGESANGGTNYLYYPDFVADSGYSIEGLVSILYLLAVREPGYFYLASLSKPDGKNPSLRSHYHVAALFPYFTEGGVFTITVFESGSETSIGEFLSANPGAFAHLVRIPSLREFDPQRFPR